MKSILWFKEISKKDVPKVGGKGANLGEMFRAGLPVPNGFCLTAQAYFDFLKKTDLVPKIKKYLRGLDVSNSQALGKVANLIKKAILGAKIPQEIQKEITKAYRQLSPQEEYVAVRSSATAEDLPKASFAGQQKTFLNVKGEKKVLEAVQGSWASLFEPRAIFYRQEQGFDHFKVGIAVPIQKMIQSEVSGVMFTLDPLTNDKTKIALEAGFGLGEAIVSGAITPDRYLLSKKDLKILEKNITKQPWIIKMVSGKNKHLRLSSKTQNQQKLTDSEIKKVAGLGLKVEKHYRFPQDIEWALEGGKIYLVQTRPVTTLKKEKLEKKEEKIVGKILLKGIAASFGVISGPVQIIHSAKEIGKVAPGDVLVTEMTNPDFVPAMKKASAIVTDRGGRTSHAAIVSRELGLPCVVGTEKATRKLQNGQIITVDGGGGIIYQGKLRPEIKKTEEKIEKLKTKTKIYVNLGEPELAKKIALKNVDGVGLLRAEFMISEIGIHPRRLIKEGKSKKFIDKLTTGLEIFAAAFYPRPVVYRATDFKTNEYRNLKGGEEFEKEEANPMIGYRGCFRYLKEKDLFNLELAALARVRQKYNNLHLMIPFVRTGEEFKAIKRIVEDSGLLDERTFKFWIMAEVPSCYFLIEKYCQLGINGVSIGSNDLTQLILGVDRDSEILAEQFDERNEAVMEAIKHIIEVCQKYKVTSSICGQAPSFYPEITEKLVRWGITSISVNPDVIDQTRKLVFQVEKKLKK